MVANTNLHHYLLLLLILFLNGISTGVLSSDVFAMSTRIYPFTCSNITQSCNSLLYHQSSGLSQTELATFYSVNKSSIEPINQRGLKQDYIISVPCTCKNTNTTRGYFYDTLYRVQTGDTFANVASKIYSGQAWRVAGEEEIFSDGNTVSIHLVCGCPEEKSQEVVTYSVQEEDTLFGIAQLLSSNVTEIENSNTRLTENPSYIDVGWVLFVPREKKGIQARDKAKRLSWSIIASIVSALILFSISISILLIIRKRYRKSRDKDTKSITRCSSAKISLLNLFQKIEIEDVKIDTERPIMYSLEDIHEATNNFDLGKKIGEGGHGTVFIGILKGEEVAIKKMKSNRSKEFFAELKALCKIHHNNVVELLGYASGDDHLYLVYTYIRNGSLYDHIHDPQLKGNSTLSWSTRVHIALDAARGIEYIHDHAKARYVHRDIKATNILLDQGFRAKVADFGLVMLVESSTEEDYVATRLVGTPGYIAPESVSELQITSKTDVFAFGVVLAELITGKPSIFRDKRGTNKMKSLASTMYTIFEEKGPITSLEAQIDTNLRGNCPIEEVYKMAELSRRCLSQHPVNRPDMRDIVPRLAQILLTTIEWDALLAGNSQVFSGVLIGR